jgi:hypothetical protein
VGIDSSQPVVGWISGWRTIDSIEYLDQRVSI